MKNNQLMMDLYELTMANGYFLDGYERDKWVIFDVFYRKNPDNGGYAIFAGLEQIVDYLLNLHFTEKDIEYLKSLKLYDNKFLEYLRNFKFTGNVYAMREGTIMYPNEPILTVEAPLVEAQIIETELLAQINHQSLIATKASRIVRAADGRPVSDFGARRAHNDDAAVYGARAAYIGGASSTATVVAGQKFGIPVSGTMAHSWVMFYKDELEAFRNFADRYPDNCILLVDTYDVLKSGVPNAIKVFKELFLRHGKPKNYGIRLDSGDLAYLSIEARKMLDKEGLLDAKIVVSNSLDEYTITSLLNQGAKIDAFGVGERMITAKSDPVFGAVYKLAAVYNPDTRKSEPRIKISETVEKITNPGFKALYRAFDENNHAVADIITMHDEYEYEQYCQSGEPVSIEVVDPERPWKKITLENVKLEALLDPIITKGKEDYCYSTPKLPMIRENVIDQLKYDIWPEEQRFENPHKHYVDMSPKYYEMKMNMLKG